MILGVVAFYLCLSFCLFAQDIKPVEPAQQTQGEFAMQLVKALGWDKGLSTGATVNDYINILKKNAVEPTGGFQPNLPITKEDRITLISKALSLEQTGAVEGKPSYVKNTAVISEFLGDVKIKRGGSNQWIKAEVGMELSENDTIKTGEGSFIHLAVGLAGRVKIKENAELLLKTISSEADKKRETVCLYLAMGEMIIDARNISKGSSFNTITPTATVGVRGTIYSVKVIEARTTIIEE